MLKTFGANPCFDRNWFVRRIRYCPVGSRSGIHDSRIRLYRLHPVLHHAKPWRISRGIPCCGLLLFFFHPFSGSVVGIRHGLEVCINPPTALDALHPNTYAKSYALQWLICLPLEIIAGALTVSYWNETLNNAIFVTILLVVVAVINLMGIRGYGEAEFLFSTVKATAVVGFM